MGHHQALLKHTAATATHTATATAFAFASAYATATAIDSATAIGSASIHPLTHIEFLWIFDSLKRSNHFCKIHLEGAHRRLNDECISDSRNLGLRIALFT